MPDGEATPAARLDRRLSQHLDLPRVGLHVQIARLVALELPAERGCRAPELLLVHGEPPLLERPSHVVASLLGADCALDVLAPVQRHDAVIVDVFPMDGSARR